MAWSKLNGTSFPMTAADCSNCFSAAGSRSIREARMAWTVAGTCTVVEGLGEAIRPALTDQGLGLHEGPHALFEKERVALRPLG